MIIYHEKTILNVYVIIYGEVQMEIERVGWLIVACQLSFEFSTAHAYGDNAILLD